MINNDVSSDMLAKQIEENLWKTLNQTKDTIPVLYIAAIYLKVALKIYKSILSHNDLKNLLHYALEETSALAESEVSSSEPVDAIEEFMESELLPKVKKVLH
jgi:hypothetical protein